MSNRLEPGLQARSARRSERQLDFLPAENHSAPENGETEIFRTAVYKHLTPPG